MKKIIGLLLVTLFALGAVSLYAVPHTMYIEIFEPDGTTHPAADDLTFEGWVADRTDEILTEDSLGCDYNETVTGFANVQVGNFPTPWAIGEMFYLEVTQTSTGNVGSGSWTLTSAAAQYLPGEDGITIVGGGTPPDPPVATAATTDGTLTFFANWDASATATGYYLDVSTVSDFSTFVPGYDNLDVENVLTYSVTATTAIDHYYRVRAYNDDGESGNSNVITVLGSTLPVELSAFTATYISDPGIALLEWTTASETDVLGFNIYRGEENDFDSSTQINVIIEPAAGTTTEPTNYDFRDLDPLVYNSTYYYWLESVDIGGESTIYSAISFTPEDGEGGYVNMFEDYLLSIYPNPVKDVATIQYAIDGKPISANVQISVYNTKGQMVETLNATGGEVQFDTSNLSSGIYFYKIKSQSFSQIKKMAIVR